MLDNSQFSAAYSPLVSVFDVSPCFMGFKSLHFLFWFQNQIEHLYLK